MRGLHAAILQAGGPFTRATETADARWFVVNTPWFKHTAIARIWPRVGCVGSASSGSQVKEQADCIEYLRFFLTTRNYFAVEVEMPLHKSDEDPRPEYEVYCSR